MHQQPSTALNSASGINAAGIGAIQPSSPWSVTTLEVLSAFRLKVGFYDGTSGTVNMAALIHSPNAGVFAPLADETLFAQAYIEQGAVTWPGECPDLAPDAMHRAIAATGEWTP